MIKAKFIKFTAYANVAIFEDDKCIGESISHEISMYPGQNYDMEKIIKQLEEVIEKQYDNQKTDS